MQQGVIDYDRDAVFLRIPHGRSRVQSNSKDPKDRHSQSPNNSKSSTRKFLRRNRSSSRILASQRSSEPKLASSRKRQILALTSIDKEKLYEDTMNAKTELNGLKIENLKLKTQMQRQTREIQQRDSQIQQLLGKQQRKMSHAQKNLHIIQNLKQVIRDVKAENTRLDNEVESFKRDIRTTRVSELEAEVKEYMQESKRLRELLEESLDLETKNKQLQNQLSITTLEKEGLQNRLDKLAPLASTETRGDTNERYRERRVSTVDEATNTTELSVEKFKKVSRDEVKLLLRHLSQRLQLQRIPKTHIAKVLFGDQFDKDEHINVSKLSFTLGAPPFSFTNLTDAKLLSRYLIEQENSDLFTNEIEISKISVPAKEIAGKLYMEIDDWSALSQEQEEQFDREIATIISENRLAFEKACQEADTEQTDFITKQQFVGILDRLELELTNEHVSYLTLLFYSFDYVLDQVPYLQFLETYGNFTVDATDEFMSSEILGSSHEDSTFDANSREGIANKLLQQVIDALDNKNRSFSSVFPNRNGTMSPDTFINGLEEIEVPKFEKKEFLALMDYLQSQEDDEEMIIDYNLLKNKIADIRHPEKVFLKRNHSLNDLSGLKEKMKNKNK